MSALHITNGDHAGDKLRGFVDGPVVLACDVLHEGPCPSVEGDAWHDVRARVLARDAGQAMDEVKASLAAADRAIADVCRAKASAERRGIVLWFEHDLFDQLALVRTLDLIVRLKPDTTETTETTETGAAATRTTSVPVVSGFSRTTPHVSLICIDRFPGVDRFIGLGQLSPDQLRTLESTAVGVTPGHFRLASDAWRAFRSPDPRDLLRIEDELSAARMPVSEGGPALPFLGNALLRFLAEYPSVGNGLSRTEALALAALDRGATDAGTLFRRTQAREAAPFMGDRSFFDILRRLASAPVPLLTVEAAPEGDPHRRGVAITDAGRDVAAGRADHVRLNGIDRWHGGVHLSGSDRSPWRWDADDETLVS